MVGPGYARDSSDAEGEGHTPESLEAELARLRWLVVHAMNEMAEQVLDQIQTTRGVAQQTDSLLAEVKRTTAYTRRVEGDEPHLRQVCSQIEEAIRDLPERSWDDYAQTCTQLARTLRRLHDTE